MTLKSVLNNMLIMFLAIGLLTSCEKENLQSPDRENASKTTLQNFVNPDPSANQNPGDEPDEEFECFEIVFPITILFPEGTEQEVNTFEELETSLDAWWDLNDAPDLEVYPTFRYPIQVIVEGDTETINNDDELDELFDYCEDEYDDDDDDEDEYDDDHEECEFEEFEDYEDCFTINFPITLIFPDGSKQVINDVEMLEDILDDWYDANPDASEEPSPEYPVSVTLEDSTTLQINTDDELDELFEMCEEYYDDYYDFDPEDLCFTVTFPISFSLPGGGTLSVLNFDDLEEKLDEWYDANEGTEDDPELIFPITITYDDGTAVVLTSEDDLEDAYDSCDD